MCSPYFVKESLEVQNLYIFREIIILLGLMDMKNVVLESQTIVTRVIHSTTYLWYGILIAAEITDDQSCYTLVQGFEDMDNNLSIWCKYGPI